MTLEVAFATTCTRLLGEEFAGPIGVAVSGGGDSTALLVLACTHFDAQNVVALSVDHGLRSEAAQELDQVARLSAQLGCAHHIFKWEGWDQKGNLQAEARAARFDLLSDWARKNGTQVILLGHTGDDQAETVLLRLARGSGVDGLAAMAEEDTRQGVRWLRPLLAQTRDELRSFLLARGTVWSEDPSNDDPSFDRIRLRQMMPELAKIGLDRERLMQTAAHMTRARAALRVATRHLAEQAVRQQAGDLLIDRAVLATAPEEIQHRLLADALCFISGNPYRPRYTALRQLTEQGGGTLHGVQALREAKHLRLTREAAALKDASTGFDVPFDDRWTLIGPMMPQDRVRILGSDGIAQLEDWRASGLPRASLASSPAIWRRDMLIAAPLAQFNPFWRAELVGNRADFLAYLPQS